MISIRNSIRYIVDSAIYIESFFHAKDKKDAGTKKDGARRILILRKDGLGDCIIFYSTLAAYREFYKNDEITLVFPNYFETLSPLLKSMDNVIWFDHARFGKSFFYRRKFLLGLNQKGFDVALYPVFTREKIGDFMMRITRAKETVGFYDRQMKSGMYSRTIAPPHSMILELDRDIYFAEQITGGKISVSFPTISIRSLEGAVADNLLREHGIMEKSFVIVFPGSGAPYKIWPPERFAAMLDELVQNDLTPVICGNKKEMALVKNIVLQSRVKEKTVNLSGQTDLATMSHLLKRSRFYFGSDTSILHLAVAVGTPTVAIVGEGSLGRFFPYGDPTYNIAIHADDVRPGTGNWIDVDLFKPEVIHPSIKNITIENAQKKVRHMIELTHTSDISTANT